MTRNSVLLIMATLCLLAAAGCNSAKQAVANDDTVPSRAVRVIEAEAVGLNGGGIQVSGVVQAQGQVRIAFQLGGLVTAVLVGQGDHVTAGQVLARLDSVPYAAQRDQASGALMQAQAMLSLTEEGARSQELAMAEAQVRSAQAIKTRAEADFNRMQQLYAEGVVAKQQIDAAESAYKQACEGLEAADKQLEMAREGARPQEIQVARSAVVQTNGALAGAQRQLDYTFLRAPISGTIVWRDIEAGMSASTGEAVFEIANLETLEITTEIPESDLTRLSVDDTAMINFPALGGLCCAATVVSIAPKAQDDTRGFPVRLNLIDPDPVIVPGLVALVEYQYQALPDGIRIPSRAILDGQVFVVTGSSAQLKTVEVLMDKGEYAYVSGVAAGDRVVINGQHYLQDGEAVTIVNALAIDEITTLDAG